LVRKGLETPENEVETMVQIHNFLSEKKCRGGRLKFTGAFPSLTLNV